jgi:NAD(P)-dependent dehydrogenase (short-subunit alcohol dehydrogenase family)
MTLGYATSKAALIYLTRCLAVALAPHVALATPLGMLIPLTDVTAATTQPGTSAPAQQPHGLPSRTHRQ